MATKQIEVEYARKITNKVMLGEWAGESGLGEELLKRLLKDKQFPLYRVIGIAKATRPKTTDYGESIKFIGQFEAESLLDKGRRVQASSLYLPGFLEEELYGLLGTDGNHGDGVTFAFEIGVKYDGKAATKYVYTARPLVQASGGDALALLREQVATAALPAPKAA